MENQAEIAAEKERLIQLLDATRKRMRKVIAKIDTQRAIYPGWTLKHFLAHLTGWDDALVVSLRHHAAGREPGTPAYRGIDEYNAQTVAERESFDYDHVFAEWEYTHRQLITIIREMPPDRFYETLVYPWSSQGTISRLIEGMCEHELEHAGEIEKLAAAAAQAQTPEQPAAQETVAQETVAQETAAQETAAQETAAHEAAAPQLLSPGTTPLLLQEKSAGQAPTQEAAPDKLEAPPQEAAAGKPAAETPAPQNGVSDQSGG